MCGNAPIVVEVFDSSTLRNALAVDSSRPLHFRALIEVDQLHALLGASPMLDAATDVFLTTRLRHEINRTEVS